MDCGGDGVGAYSVLWWGWGRGILWFVALMGWGHIVVCGGDGIGHIVVCGGDGVGHIVVSCGET